MIQVRADVTVARPVADVFGYWADPDRLPPRRSARRHRPGIGLSKTVTLATDVSGQ